MIINRVIYFMSSNSTPTYTAMSIAKSFIVFNNPSFLFVICVLITVFNFDTDFVLRISGYPKLNIFRRILWK